MNTSAKYRHSNEKDLALILPINPCDYTPRTLLIQKHHNTNLLIKTFRHLLHKAKWIEWIEI